MKKLYAAVLSVLLVLSFSLTAFAASVEVDARDLFYRAGDVDCSQTVDTDDFSALAKILLGSSSAKYEKTADLNGDGVIDICDLVVLNIKLA